MAKFCSNCGRPLSEGEVCNCTHTDVNSDTKDVNVVKNHTENINDINQNSVETNPGNLDNANTNGDIDNAEKTTVVGSVSGVTAQNDTQNGYRNNTQPEYQNPYGSNNDNHSENYSGQWKEKESDFEKKIKQFGREIGKVFQRIFPLLKSPVKEIKNIMATDDKMGFYMIVVHILAMALVGAIAEESFLNVRAGHIFYSIFNVSLIRLILYAIVFVGTMDFLLAAILFFTTKVIFNCKTTYNKMMTIVGGMAVVNAVTLFTGTLIGIIFAGLGMLVISLGMIFSILVLVFAYSESVTMDVDKKIFSLLISSALLVIVAANIIYLVF